MSILHGELVIQDQKYHFLFEDYMLSIYEFGSEAHPLKAFISALDQQSHHIELPETIMGTCYPDGHKVLFMQLFDAGYTNNVRKISVNSWFEIKPNVNFPFPISQISVIAKELNYIYPPAQMYSYTLNDNGLISTINFDHSKESFKWQFTLDGQSITAESGFLHSYKWGSTPVDIQSAFFCSFDPTEDYEFIVHLFDIVSRLLQYLCYRQNISISNGYLYASDEEQKHHNIGTFNAKWLETQYPEGEKWMSKRVIDFKKVNDSMSVLLQRISDNTLYLRHIPQNSKDTLAITPARTVLLMAAFESEFSFSYPKEIDLPQEIKEKREQAIKGIKSLIAQPEYEQVKEDFSRFIGELKSTSLRLKLEHTLADFNDCISIFAKKLFAINGVEFSWEIVAKTITRMRNDISHGRLNTDYGVDTYLSITIMPYLLYAMQLRSTGLDDKGIQKVINNLFQLNMAL